jgi:hypothetical protein
LGYSAQNRSFARFFRYRAPHICVTRNDPGTRPTLHGSIIRGLRDREIIGCGVSIGNWPRQDLLYYGFRFDLPGTLLALANEAIE